ncbi:serine/threonine-protein kinase [Actinomadura rudentiformis]|uniref:Protein kinase n=1 Tax=Actinomadura rudentiformis TaxID=359158 RepID=A0A6H9YJN3_9ACTN|nr:protein kinase [Actinomadura rudentiformis]KAB2339214.1 protein kinase [Actinomadura rudentiformis]
MSGAALRALRASDPERIGPYRLLARLGTGGMGQVYLGRSQGRRLVAVKVVHPHFADNAAFRRRFAKEVAAARRIGGFYTAQVVDADTDADPPWLVTEYIAGPSLQEAIDENGPLPEVAVAALGAGLAEGLGAVHDQNVIHRDLKPGNVLLAQDGPRIIDFGIARAMDAPSQSVSMVVVGTPGYMSPEQYVGGDIETSSDVFCLAAVLAFAATGRHPFGEGPADALGYRVRHEDPDLTGVPASLWSLVAGGLEKDPDDRPAVGEFLDRCSALAAGEAMSLPETFTTMIATRVAETEVFVGRPEEKEARPPQDEQKQTRRQRPSEQRPPEQQKPEQGRAPQGQRPSIQPSGLPPARPPGRPSTKPDVGVVAGVVGVLLVVVLIAVASANRSGVTSKTGAGSPRTSTATETPSETPSSSRTSSFTSGSGSTYSPSPTPDPTYEAFDQISVGDCLDAYKDPYDSTEWTKTMPNAVSCSRSDASLKVFGIEDSSSSCDAEALDGESWWRSPTHDGDNIYLCVRRQFRQGECFLGKKGSTSGRVAITGHGLMTSWGCGKSTVPKGFNYILKFTGYYESRCPTGSRTWDNYLKGVLCARVA